MFPTPKTSSSAFDIVTHWQKPISLFLMIRDTLSSTNLIKCPYYEYVGKPVVFVNTRLPNMASIAECMDRVVVECDIMLL